MNCCEQKDLVIWSSEKVWCIVEVMEKMEEKDTKKSMLENHWK